MKRIITLDEDVEKKPAAEVRRRKGATFKDVVNEMLRIELLTKRELEKTELFKIMCYSHYLTCQTTSDEVMTFCVAQHGSWSGTV
jgi:excinuclease UvrABC helicase subunit UvrB